MQDMVGKVFAIVLAVAIFFGYPILAMYEQQDNSTRQFVEVQTTEFVDSVRNLGYITPRMYNEFRQSINITGNIYDVNLEHKHQSYTPVFDDVLDATTYKEEYSVSYISNYTEEITNTLFPKIGPSGKYYMSRGDYFLVSVTNRGKTKGTRVKELLLNIDLPKEVIAYRYGGMIKNEIN